MYCLISRILQLIAASFKIQTITYSIYTLYRAHLYVNCNSESVSLQLKAPVHGVDWVLII